MTGKGETMKQRIDEKWGLVFTSDKGNEYMVLSQAEMRSWQDYTLDENWVEQTAVNEEYDTMLSDYYQLFIYPLGDMSQYIGEPSEKGGVEWVEETIKKYEENK